MADQQQQRFKGKVAIVTGASSGMGLAAAAQLAREGAKVVMVSRSKDKLEAAAASIKPQAGGDVTTFVADISKDDDNAAIVAATLSAFGRLDIAFLNAGIFAGAKFSELTDDIIDKVLGTNLKGVAFGLKHMLTAIEKSGGGGSVVVNSSVGAVRPSQNPQLATAAVYNASKAAVDLLVKFAAIEASEHNTRVNAVAPGVVRTEIMGEEATDSAYEDLAKSLQLMQRAGRSEEVAEFVCFLASHQASFITGSVHLIDGGAAIRM